MAEQQQHAEEHAIAMAERLARMDTKLDQLLDWRADQELRLRALERRDAQVMVVCAILSVGVPILMRVILKV